MHGIIEGLHDTEAYSPVFVFTDAGSKDLEEKESVKMLSQVCLLFCVIWVIRDRVNSEITLFF